MLKFALKNMGIKKVQIILIVISIIISASVGVLAFNVSNQVSDGITENAGYYSLIIGPAGSQTQLAMNSMYFTEEPLGTFPYYVYENLKNDKQRVLSAIPFAMADSYNGAKVVGTTSAFLSDKIIGEGDMFTDGSTLQAVVGSRVAKENGLKVGDKIYTSHSAQEDSLHDKAITVVGILEESFSVYDTVVFTQVETLWEMHDHEGEHEGDGEHEGEHEGDSEHEGEHTHMHGMICAILVNTTNPSYALQMCEEFKNKVVMQDGKEFPLQAIEPMNVVRGVLDDTDETKYIVFVLSAIILIMNIIVISIITLLNMYHSAKEIALMRLIGISMKKINLLYLIQNSIIGFISTVAAFGVSRLCLLLMGDYVANMGVVLKVGKLYPLELVILLGVFLISVIPTIICTFVMAKRDSLAE